MSASAPILLQRMHRMHRVHLMRRRQRAAPRVTQ